LKPIRGDEQFQIPTLKPRLGKSFLVSEFKDLTVESTDSNKNIKSAIGFGIAGAMLLGPVGAFSHSLAP
jgi:hypothetical protein